MSAVGAKSAALIEQARQAGKPLSRTRWVDQPATEYRGPKLVMKRTQDSQRSKVYAAERVLSLYSSELSDREAHELFQKILGSKYVIRNYGTVNAKLVIDGRLKVRSYARGRELVKLSPSMVTDHTIVHEVAHLYTSHTDPGHDWLFCAVYIDLVRKFMSERAAKALKDSFKRNKVRHTPPRKRRQMTPEQKRAASERMAKARAARGVTSVGKHAFAVRPTREGVNVEPWRLVRNVNKWGDYTDTQYVPEALVRSSKEGIEKILKELDVYWGRWYDFKAVKVDEIPRHASFRDNIDWSWND